MTIFAIYLIVGLLVALANVLFRHGEKLPFHTWASLVIINGLVWPFFLAQLVYSLFKKTPYCSFCGYVAEDTKGILAHIEKCEKHPAHQWAVDRDKYLVALEDIAAKIVSDDDETDMIVLEMVNAMLRGRK